MEQENKRVNKKDEEFKRKLAEKYNIKLDNIEQVEIKGKQYFKFVDPEKNEVTLLENMDQNRDLTEQFIEVQKNYSVKGQDGNEIAEKIFENEKKYSKKEVQFVNFNELFDTVNNEIQPNNRFNEYLAKIPLERRKEIRELIKTSRELDLVKINFEDGIALNNNNELIGASYNKQTGEIDISTAKKITYENEKFDSNDQQLILVTDEEIEEKLINIQNNPYQTVTIGEVDLNKEQLDRYYNYPEILEKSKNKSLIGRIINVYTNLLKKQEVKNNIKEPPKILTLKKPKGNYPNAAFVYNVLLMILSSFALGILTAILMILFIK